MWLFSSLLSFLIALGLHAAAGRLPLISNSVLRFLAVGTAVGLALVAWLFTAYAPLAVEQLTALLVYAFACVLHIFLFASTLSSVSANLLLRLSRQPLLPEDVAQLYSGRRMTEVRLERLIGSGFLSAGPKGLTLTAVGARTVSAYERLRSLFRHVDAR